MALATISFELQWRLYSFLLSLGSVRFACLEGHDLSAAVGWRVFYELALGDVPFLNGLNVKGFPDPLETRPFYKENIKHAIPAARS
jgi:hypothetical protein